MKPTTYQKYDDQFINMIKDAVDVEQVLNILGAEFSPPNSKGEIIMCCPFHHDTHPSLNINIDSKQYLCWSCRASGEIIGFTMRYGNMSFVEAIQLLAKISGIISPGIGDEFQIEKAKFDYMLKKELEEQQKYMNEMIDGETLEGCNATVSSNIGLYVKSHPDNIDIFDDILERFDSSVISRDIESVRVLKQEIIDRIRAERDERS